MTQRVLVLLAVGLTPELLGEHTPALHKLAQTSGVRPLKTVTPAVTTSVQASLLTGLPPGGHGAVGNGWFERDVAEVWMWKQSNRLVDGEKIWEAARRKSPDFTCAKLFWWFNMYSSADISVTPRPIYRANGRKFPDHYTYPPALRAELTQKFGAFPLFRFWGPMADIVSSEWIADCTEDILSKKQPHLTLCYLPHLDYNLQRLGPDLSHPRLQQDLREIDAVCERLMSTAEQQGYEVIVVSEYGITRVKGDIALNRAFRRQGWIQVREECGGEILDPAACSVFALSDHQIAHIYVRDKLLLPEVRTLVESIPGVESVLGKPQQQEIGLDHPRSGDLVAISQADRWFSYYYWLDNERAPDFAHIVDIHHKPGYDPMELFIDPAIPLPKLAVAKRLLKQKLGLCSLLDVIPISGTDLVKGSHGRLTDREEQGPLVMTTRPELLPEGALDALDFKEFVLKHCFN